MTRTVTIAAVTLAVACARSGLELEGVLDDDSGDDDGATGGRSGSPPTGGTDTGGSSTGGGSTGGTAATGGSGGVTPGGSGGRPMVPIDPGGPIPNCRADSPAAVAPKDNHWLYLQGRASGQTDEGRYVIELTPDGPRNLTFLNAQGGFFGWSADGRFLAMTASERPYPFELFDFSRGGPPVRVDLPSRDGFLVWSRSGARYALDPEPSIASPSELVIIDVTTATERFIDLPELQISLDLESWSPNDRYIALAGAEGIHLVDTSGSELELSTIYDRHAQDLSWSPDSRYLAFESRLSDTSAWLLYVADTQSGHLKIVESLWEPRQFFGWAGDSSLVFEDIIGLPLFVDVSPRYLDSVLLGQTGFKRANGIITTGGKCYVYDGFCGAVLEDGICVTALPPDPLKPAVLIHRADGNIWAKTSAGTGDQLLLRTDAEPWLINVELDGGELVRRFVTDGTTTHRVASVPGWNPSGRADWLAYFADPSPDRSQNVRPRLWHRETAATFELVSGEDDAERSAWSPDGRYLAFEVEDAAFKRVYHVQEVLDGRLGRSWRLDEIVPSERVGSLDPDYMQP